MSCAAPGDPTLTGGSWKAKWIECQLGEPAVVVDVDRGLIVRRLLDAVNVDVVAEKPPACWRPSARSAYQ